MQKLKLFLLWWIFTLVWIFNFSSAYQSSIECIDWTCNPSPFYESAEAVNVCFSADEMISDDPDLDSDFYYYLVTYYDRDDNIQFDVLNLWSTICISSLWSVYLQTPSNISSLSWVISVEVWWIWNDENFWWTILNWFSDLTPAIDWLKVTIALLIPYVVYIWIWVLLAVLWFYAIRWLVNWMSNKINSYFKSKRG